MGYYRFVSPLAASALTFIQKTITIHSKIGTLPPRTAFSMNLQYIQVYCFINVNDGIRGNTHK